MSDYLKAVKITEKVYWVGAIDWDIRNFHGYATQRGTTYNAFLVLDEKVTLIDTVKAPFFSELMARISSVIDPKKIDYIVSNHSEMDHSGSLPAAVQAIQPEKVFASPMGEKDLKGHFHDALNLTVVKTGDKISLGSNNLSFVETKMLHWPDSMVSYLDGEKILFSQDAFGMHLAGTPLYADEYPSYIIETEAKKYFANILLLQAPKILDLLNQLPGLNLDIRLLAPDHGPLWRRDIGRILELYRQYALQEGKRKAVVIFDTMWHSTEKLAASITDGIRQAGIEVEQICMASSDRSAVMTRLMDAGLLVVGSPTMNNNVFPTVADVLTYMRGLKPQNLLGGAFGSFGWSGEAPKQIAQELTNMGVEQPLAPLTVKYVPTGEDLARAFEFGNQLGGRLVARNNH
ncbi:FprA family A-type flavoprotein [Victivallis sp. Marseille-Q1083]|uniref:FprA family A-type flavoprotein n=1 Tax=Victivallis sp. Marseille-Q1083 TaxID=2717288 RepID=UPI001C37A1DF|nr:FprA family A-type flavoprotein [Victivallis sp. Marseille-Q1083]